MAGLFSGPPKPPKPSAQELAARQAEANLLNQYSSALQQQQSQQAALAPILYQQAGIEPIYSNGQISGFRQLPPSAEQEAYANALRAQSENLQFTQSLVPIQLQQAGYQLQYDAQGRPSGVSLVPGGAADIQGQLGLAQLQGVQQTQPLQIDILRTQLQDMQQRLPLEQQLAQIQLQGLQEITPLQIELARSQLQDVRPLEVEAARAQLEGVQAIQPYQIAAIQRQLGELFPLEADIAQQQLRNIQELQPGQQQLVQSQLGGLQELVPLQIQQALRQIGQLSPIETDIALQQFRNIQALQPLQQEVAQQQLRDILPAQQQLTQTQLSNLQALQQPQQDIALRQLQGIAGLQPGQQQLAQSQLEALQAAQPLQSQLAQQQLQTGQQQAALNQSLLQRAGQAIRGELPTDPTLARELKEQEFQLGQDFRRQLGAGFATSSPYLEAKANFDKRRAELLYGAQQGEISRLTGLALQGQATPQAQLSGGQLAFPQIQSVPQQGYPQVSGAAVTPAQVSLQSVGATPVQFPSVSTPQGISGPGALQQPQISYTPPSAPGQLSVPNAPNPAALFGQTATAAQGLSPFGVSPAQFSQQAAGAVGYPFSNMSSLGNLAGQFGTSANNLATQRNQAYEQALKQSQQQGNLLGGLGSALGIGAGLLLAPATGGMSAAAALSSNLGYAGLGGAIGGGLGRLF